ncbi:MAG TPA: PilN domain-containing protein, partial [bacterium]|nr:PilN domain-containing protein [bacterium]
ITLSIPEQVWLKSLECKVEDRQLLLEATAQSEQGMKEFVLRNLQNQYGENAVTLGSIQRGGGFPPTVQFDVTIHLPTETVTVALPEGEGI